VRFGGKASTTLFYVSTATQKRRRQKFFEYVMTADEMAEYFGRIRDRIVMLVNFGSASDNRLQLSGARKNDRLKPTETARGRARE
jgi:hypothetical protein